MGSYKLFVTTIEITRNYPVARLESIGLYIEFVEILPIF